MTYGQKLLAYVNTPGTHLARFFLILTHQSMVPPNNDEVK